MILKGRRKIVTEFSSEDLKNPANLAILVNSTMPVHLENKAEIDWLVNYKNGIQPILDKTKTVRPEINNVLVINHAQMITRTIIGYFLGTPIQYIQSGAAKKEQIDTLNNYVNYEDKASTDKEIGEFQSIAGTAYRIIYTDGALGDEVPFEQRSLDPSTTYVVYANDVTDKPVCAVNYYRLLNNRGTEIGYKMYIYTDHGVYTVTTHGGRSVNKTSEMVFKGYDVGGVPVIEYPNNQWRIGDWELVIGLMDAICKLDSGRLDDIDQIVQSLLVFINAEIDPVRYAEMRELGVVSLTNKTLGGTATGSDVKTIVNNLDQTGISLLSTEFESMLYALIGIPDRNNRAGGGGDTGTAVELRDGWADLETVARNKELAFKKSEKQSLRIMLRILNNKMAFDLTLLDVDIKFSRNKNNNLQVKTQSYQTLLMTKTLAPADCLTIVDLVSDVNEFLSRGEAFWGDSFAGKVQSDTAVESAQVALDNVKNPPADPAGTVYNDSKSALAKGAKANAPTKSTTTK